MALKPRYKRRIFWSFITLISIAILALVLVPPMITLNGMKPKIEQAITEQTGVEAKINGNINFSLLGRATIVAHDVDTTIGNIGALMFSVPLTSIFDLNNAPLTGDITVYNATATIHTLIPKSFNHPIEIHNSYVKFKNRDFEIISATLENGNLSGIVRTDNHKYDIDFEQDLFYVRNQNDKLEITGQLYADGSVRGHMTMETDNINKWFGFEEPKINKTIDLTTRFEWDGGQGFSFTDIHANNFTGNIEILPNGDKKVQLSAKDIDYDLSFLFEPSRIFYKTNFDLDFYGNLKFGRYYFKHLKINALGTNNNLQINNIIADDLALTGGIIDKEGAKDIMITMPYKGMPAMCLFSGTPDAWKCSKFTYGNYYGSLSVSGDKFEIFVQSNEPMPERETLIKWARELGNTGRINFQFSDIGGSFDISADDMKPTYTFAENKTLQWLNPNIQTIPKFMKNVRGDFKWKGEIMLFVPYSERWTLELTKTEFRITGKNAKEWLPNIDLQSLNNLEYVVSGTYNKDTISNLKIEIAGQEFTGSVSGEKITLHTKLLNVDAFMNQDFFDNYEELEFLTNAPIMLPFSLPVNLSLSADSMIYNGIEFKNFVYALKSDLQTFSITDKSRGNLLATLRKDKNQYKIFAQLNRFVINGNLLSSLMPLNIRDTTITAEINMNTFGNIAHDIEYNMSGNMDLSFEDGYLVGLGIDNFYATAENLTTLNAEFVLSNALEQGESWIKKMRIIGDYKNGDFKTTSPIELQLRHTDAIGSLEIVNNQMQAQFKMILRGTSPSPAPIELSISPTGKRGYSLSEIMINLDPSYMRTFVQTHDKF